MAQATYDDVNLILRLYDMRREDKMRAARSWFVANFRPKTMTEFNHLCPPGSEQNAMARQVTSYWDMVGSFIRSGVLNQELFFQSNREMLLTWIRIQPIIEEMRTAFKDSSYMANLQAVGEQYIEFLGKIGPETYATFKARVGG
jgi:hypothetical protein